MKKLLCLLISCFLSVSVWAVSFDCKKFNTGVYKIICESPELSKLDDELSEKYNLAVKSAGNNGDFKKIVREALKVRDLCKDEACLIDWYRKSLAAYKHYDSEITSEQTPQSSSWLFFDGKPMGISRGGEFLSIVTINEMGYYWMFFSPNDPKFKYCKDGDGGMRPTASVTFNGVLVRMVEVCDSGIKFFTPATFDGSQYVINQFISKNEVVLTNSQNKVFAIFGADGFKKSLNQFKQYRGGI